MARRMGERFDGFVPGPLDQLAPGLRRRAERWPALPVHPRVVYAQPPGGSRSIVLASFRAAASARALHAALKPQVEAALLAELSRPPAELVTDASAPCALELYALAAFPFDPTPALAPFAFALAPLDDASARHALALLRREAQQVDGLAGDEARMRFRAPCARAAHALCEAFADGLRARASDWGVWGSQPGQLARAGADLLRELGYAGVEPSRSGIERLEAVIVPEASDVLRWIDPLSFQALCDLVAVTATVCFGRAVQWGVCEPDPDSGLAPPPVLRVEAKSERSEPVLLPLGEHVLRWCVMPRRQGETVPTLGAWAEHEFA